MTGLADDPMLAHLTRQTDRLLESVSRLDQPSVRAASRLPGWSRGHVLTHLARNADALGRVAQVAVTGEVLPMYASAEQREADIRAGAGRPIGELAADLETSAERLLAVLAAARADRLDRAVPTGRGWDMTAREVPWFRVREVVYHHVDLDGPFTFADVPDGLVRTCLQDCVGRLTEAPTTRVVATFDAGPVLELILGDEVGSGAGSGPVQTVHGSGADLLAWLTGRSNGLTLSADDSLPVLPAWG